MPNSDHLVAVIAVGDDPYTLVFGFFDKAIDRRRLRLPIWACLSRNAMARHRANIALAMPDRSTLPQTCGDKIGF